LLDISPTAGSTDPNSYSFLFDLDVEFNSACGTLDGTIDIVADGTYITEISLQNSQIIDAFDC
jgi:hypothetical protein